MTGPSLTDMSLDVTVCGSLISSIWTCACSKAFVSVSRNGWISQSRRSMSLETATRTSPTTRSASTELRWPTDLHQYRQRVSHSSHHRRRALEVRDRCSWVCGLVFSLYPSPEKSG